MFAILFSGWAVYERQKFMFDSFNPSQCRVALLSGGTSGEREISLASGNGAYDALVEAGFQVSKFDPAKKSDLKELIEGDFDVAFLCLHGKGGEDGVPQGFLEMIGLPYTGSGIWSCALSIDKIKSKMFYRQAGIPTPESVCVIKGASYDVEEIIAQTGDHCVVKPATEGSSLGVYIGEGAAELQNSIEKAFELDDQILVERYIGGVELTVAVLGNDEPSALPIIEIIPKSESYDFESKYAPGGSQHICPARLSSTDAAMIQSLAVRAHNALGCAGVSRTDFILDDKGVAWALETNTIPGMTKTSLLPDAARAAGISFSQLCTKLIEYALEK